MSRPFPAGRRLHAWRSRARAVVILTLVAWLAPAAGATAAPLRVAVATVDSVGRPKTLTRARRSEKARAGTRKRHAAPAAKGHLPVPKRAKVGERVPVQITYYCLQGRTRTGHLTRAGIVAADPRVFPLRRHVELFVGKKSLGSYRVDDTGGLIRGHIVDVWVPSCADARHRGRRRGAAVLLAKGEQRVVSRE